MRDRFCGKLMTCLEPFLSPPLTAYLSRYEWKDQGDEHVINFPQNLSRIATVVHQRPADIPFIVR
jgi:hypothetical protein